MILGGVIDGLQLNDQSMVDIRGGSFFDDPLSVQDDSILNIHGFGLEFSGGHLTGTLADGTRANIAIEVRESGSLILHEVPEPSVRWPMILAVLCSYSMLRRQRKRRKITVNSLACGFAKTINFVPVSI